MLFKTRSAAVYGIDANLIDVEVDVSGQKLDKDNFNTVGLPDAAVRESRERVRSALRNSGYDIPPTHITVNLAPADISKQVPAWSLLTSAYLFRDVAHLKKTFKSDVGRDFVKLARDQLGIEVITPVYFGSRHVNLKPDRPIRTPADLAGIKLRMPPGEFWQFLGESIGVNPTPVAFAEVYTALQTGAIDGQDNPLLLSKLMKFYEVTSQFVLTSHVIGYDLMTVSAKAWDAMSPALQTKFRAAAEKAIDDYTTKFNGQEKDVIEFFKAQGKKVYTPDVQAFRTYAQKKYVDKYGQDWPKGALERINAL